MQTALCRSLCLQMTVVTLCSEKPELYLKWSTGHVYFHWPMVVGVQSLWTLLPWDLMHCHWNKQKLCPRSKKKPNNVLVFWLLESDLSSRVGIPGIPLWGLPVQHPRYYTPLNKMFNSQKCRAALGHLQENAHWGDTISRQPFPYIRSLTTEL